MGVTIESKNHSMDLGYGGFYNLREKIAELTASDIYEHYKKLGDAPYDEEKRKWFFEEYDSKISEISKKYRGEKDLILNFLYASDGNGTISVEACKAIYEVIKDYDDDILYGYIGKKDCARFRDFKEIVKDCIDNECEMEWF